MLHTVRSFVFAIWQDNSLEKEGKQIYFLKNAPSTNMIVSKQKMLTQIDDAMAEADMLNVDAMVYWDYQTKITTFKQPRNNDLI